MVRYGNIEDHSSGVRGDLPGAVQRSQLRTMQNIGIPNMMENAYEQLSPPELVLRKRGNTVNGARDYQELDSLPTQEEVLNLFEEFIEVNLPLSNYEENKYRQMTIQQKWKLLCQQNHKSPTHRAKYYVDELKRHGGANRKRRSWGRANKDIAPLNNVLRKLKSDLVFAQGFANEFVSQLCRGVDALLEALNDLLKDQAAANTTKKSKQDLYKQFMQDELDCLLCLKFACRCEEGLAELLQFHHGMSTIAECAYSPQIQTRITALQILTLSCKTPGGFQRVIKVTSRLRIKYEEEVRFLNLVQMLTPQAPLKFQLACVRFFNELWNCTQSTNAKVYLQFELEQAGFDPHSLEKYDRGTESEYEFLQKELDKWRKQYINVGGARTELQDMETRNVYLRDEINRLGEKVKVLEAGEEKRRRSENQWMEKCHEYRERAAELQDTVESLKQLFVSETGREPDPNLVQEASKPLDIYGTIKIQREQLNNAAESATGSSEVPAFTLRSQPSSASLPLPPVPPPSFLSKTVRKKVVDVNVNLPTLHWISMPLVTGTMFEDIDDEAKLREIDFREFENLFKLPTAPKSKEGRGRLERALLKSADQIVFVEVNRAKNMIITKRRIGLTAREIKDAIDICDLNKMPGELAELLLKYLPTKDELKNLAQHVNAYSEMGEAEQFLFHMAQVERLESKLSLLAFIGVFDEMTEKVIPDIKVLHENSLSVVRNVKLKKIFEIILAFGNYMNSNKKGYAQGFKIESLAKLSEVKSTDKSITLLHYLEEFVATRYPELYDFYEDLDLNLERGVCYQAINSDVLGLRKGLDLVKYEKEKQSTNITIEEFHDKSVGQVARIAESFHKMEAYYQKLCALFGENYKLIDTDEIFKPLVDFAKNFQKAAEDNKRRKPDRDSYLKPVVSPLSYKRQQISPNASQNGPIVPHLNLSTSSSTQNGVTKPKENGVTRFTFDETPYVNTNQTSDDETVYDDVISEPRVSQSDVFYENAKSPVRFDDSKPPKRVHINEIPTEVSNGEDENGQQNSENVLSPSRTVQNTPLGTPRTKFVYNGNSTEYDVPSPRSDQRAPHKPIIKQPGESRGKLPRVPIDVTSEDYQTYYNIYNLHRTDSNKGKDILPNKPQINKDHAESITGQEYEELPYERMHKNPHPPKKEESAPPPLPAKSDLPPPRAMNGAPRALPSPPQLDRGMSTQISDALGLLDKVLDDETERETIDSRL